LEEKEGTVVVLIAPLGGCRMLAVLNAKRVVRGRLGTVVKNVHWDLLDRAMTLMLHNANNANWGKRPRLKVQLRAVGVI